MGEYLATLIFLAVAFAAFGLVHRNRHEGCSGCESECDAGSCENKPRA